VVKPASVEERVRFASCLKDFWLSFNRAPISSLSTAAIHPPYRAKAGFELAPFKAEVAAAD
jgi:hypothetical protein